MSQRAGRAHKASPQRYAAARPPWCPSNSLTESALSFARQFRIGAHRDSNCAAGAAARGQQRGFVRTSRRVRTPENSAIAPWMRDSGDPGVLRGGQDGAVRRGEVAGARASICRLRFSVPVAVEVWRATAAWGQWRRAAGAAVDQGRGVFVR
ncbi:hypothetical protein RHA1_ro08661 (plasmid) [Rhodococcus jostii RHA1]|uniref:Uncharacterized protein n=1 Tax=Rhodococcus jostii (strain RHA1) TaxID=101510 RepID=Q0RYD1_RHOJR|nr:hypothetical protein RHA1_ro08661 [Rhodococcus jostii RHA1]